MTAVYIIVGLVVVAAIVFALMRKPQPAQLQAPDDTGKRPLPKPAERHKRELPPPPPPKVTVRDTPLAKQERQAAEQEIKEEPAPSKRRAPVDMAGLRKGLAQTRTGFIAKLAALFTGKKEIDPNIVAELEEIMLTSDVGVKTTQAILGRIKDGLDKNELKDNDAVWGALRAEATRILSLGPISEEVSRPIRVGKKLTVVLMVGVNGVGKTTTIGKLATKLKNEGKRVIFAAGDTFRAAAVQQLEVWGKRVDAEVIKGKEGADPGAVAFEATTKARESGADVLFVDTAGRLQTKTPLMDEIKKVRKTIGKAYEGAPHETLLVLDATTGQNALSQAALFKEAIDITGIVLTKLDGTAKGGIVLAICDELKVPVRYIGLGERAEDLKEFDAESFVEALFGDKADEARAA